MNTGSASPFTGVRILAAAFTSINYSLFQMSPCDRLLGNEISLPKNTIMRKSAPSYRIRILFVICFLYCCSTPSVAQKYIVDRAELNNYIRDLRWINWLQTILDKDEKEVKKMVERNKGFGRYVNTFDYGVEFYQEMKKGNTADLQQWFNQSFEATTNYPASQLIQEYENLRTKIGDITLTNYSSGADQLKWRVSNYLADRIKTIRKKPLTEYTVGDFLADTDWLFNYEQEAGALKSGLLKRSTINPRTKRAYDESEENVSQEPASPLFSIEKVRILVRLILLTVDKTCESNFDLWHSLSGLTMDDKIGKTFAAKYLYNKKGINEPRFIEKIKGEKFNDYTRILIDDLLLYFKGSYYTPLLKIDILRKLQVAGIKELNDYDLDHERTFTRMDGNTPIDYLIVQEFNSYKKTVSREFTFRFQPDDACIASMDLSQTLNFSRYELLPWYMLNIQREDADDPLKEQTELILSLTGKQFAYRQSKPVVKSNQPKKLADMSQEEIMKLSPEALNELKEEENDHLQANQALQGEIDRDNYLLKFLFSNPQRMEIELTKLYTRAEALLDNLKMEETKKFMQQLRQLMGDAAPPSDSLEKVIVKFFKPSMTRSMMDSATYLNQLVSLSNQQQQDYTASLSAVKNGLLEGVKHKVGDYTKFERVQAKEDELLRILMTRPRSVSGLCYYNADGFTPGQGTLVITEDGSFTLKGTIHSQYGSTTASVEGKIKQGGLTGYTLVYTDKVSTGTYTPYLQADNCGSHTLVIGGEGKDAPITFRFSFTRSY